MAVRERIREHYREHRITANKLAAISGIMRYAFSNIFFGCSNSAAVAPIKKICDGLNIAIRDFFNADCFRGLEQEIK